MRRRYRIELSVAATLAAQQEHLSRGGVMGDGITDIAAGDDCELTLVNPTGTQLVLAAQAVWAGPTGTAFAFRDVSTAALGVIARWAREAVPIEASPGRAEAKLIAPRDEPPDDEDDDEGEDDAAEDGGAADGSGRGGGVRRPVSRETLTLRERLRGLSQVEQQRMAREGEAAERIILERIYGKAVWEPLLRNPRLTQPEVTHIARMGALPKPLIEVVVGNLAWLQWAQVRRALLGNPRLGLDLVDRVLRATPKVELRLIAVQSIYPAPVRAAAKKLLLGG